MNKRAETKWYKVTDAKGRSVHQGFKYSLPGKDGRPGEWHEIEGDLKEHANAFHLTGSPVDHKGVGKTAKTRVFLAETEGETRNSLDGETLLARKVKLVKELSWSEFVPSKAMALLRAAWNADGTCGAMGRSWRRLNSTMQAALHLAIETLAEFHEDDFRRFAKSFNSSYWIGDGEYYYRRAIDGPHGPNPSAYQAIEAWLGREPFIVETDPVREPGRRERLYVGKRLTWFDGGVVTREKMLTVVVTSFDDAKGTVTICAYKRPGKTERWEPDPCAGQSDDAKIARRFTVSHAAIDAHHAAINAARKAANEAKESEAVERSLASLPEVAKPIRSTRGA